MDLAQEIEGLNAQENLIKVSAGLKILRDEGLIYMLLYSAEMRTMRLNSWWLIIPDSGGVNTALTLQRLSSEHTHTHTHTHSLSHTHTHMFVFVKSGDSP